MVDWHESIEGKAHRQCDSGANQRATQDRTELPHHSFRNGSEGELQGHQRQGEADSKGGARSEDFVAAAQEPCRRDQQHPRWDGPTQKPENLTAHSLLSRADVSYQMKQCDRESEEPARYGAPWGPAPTVVDPKPCHKENNDLAGKLRDIGKSREQEADNLSFLRWLVPIARWMPLADWPHLALLFPNTDLVWVRLKIVNLAFVNFFSKFVCWINPFVINGLCLRLFLANGSEVWGVVTRTGVNCAVRTGGFPNAL